MARPGWWWLAVVAWCGLVGGVAGGGRAWGAESKDEAVEAEMLKDLDLLRDVDVAQQGELLKRLGFWERLGMLQRLRYLESTTPPPEPAAKEEK